MTEGERPERALIHRIEIDPELQVNDNLEMAAEELRGHDEIELGFNKPASESLLRGVIEKLGPSLEERKGVKVERLNSVSVDFKDGGMDISVNGSGRGKKILGIRPRVGFGINLRLEQENEESPIICKVGDVSPGLIRGDIESQLGGEMVNIAVSDFLREELKQKGVEPESVSLGGLTEGKLKVGLIRGFEPAAAPAEEVVEAGIETASLEELTKRYQAAEARINELKQKTFGLLAPPLTQSDSDEYSRLVDEMNQINSVREQRFETEPVTSPAAPAVPETPQAAPIPEAPVTPEVIEPEAPEPEICAPEDVHEGAEFYDLRKVISPKEGKFYVLFWGKDGKIYLDYSGRDGVKVIGKQRATLSEYRDLEFARDKIREKIDKIVKGGNTVLGGFPIYKGMSNLEMEELDAKTAISARVNPYSPDELLEAERKRKETEPGPTEPTEPLIRPPEPLVPPRPPIPPTRPPEPPRPIEPEGEEPKERDPLFFKLEELAKRRANIFDAISEFERAEKSAAGQERRQTDFAKSEKAKAQDYEHLVGVAIKDYEKTLFEVNDYIHGKTVEIPPHEESPELQRYNDTVKLLEINQGRLDKAADDEQRALLSQERQRLQNLQSYFRGKAGVELEEVGLRDRIDGLGKRLQELKIQRIEKAQGSSERLLLLREYDMLLDERIGALLEAKRAMGEDMVTPEATKVTLTKVNGKSRETSISRVREVPLSGVANAIKVEEHIQRKDGGSVINPLVEVESADPKAAVDVWADLRKAGVNITPQAYVKGKAEALILTDITHADREEAMDLARLNTLWTNSGESPDVVPQWLSSQKDDVVAGMIEDAKLASENGYQIDPDAYVFRHDVRKSRVDAVVFNIESGVIETAKPREQIMSQSVQGIRDKFALRFGLYSQEEWNQRYPEYALRDEDMPRPEDVKDGARFYEAVALINHNKGTDSDDLFWWDGENVWAEYGFYRESRRKVSNPIKITETPTRTREDAKKAIDEFLENYKLKGISMVRNVPLPEKFLKAK